VSNGLFVKPCLAHSNLSHAFLAPVESPYILDNPVALALLFAHLPANNLDDVTALKLNLVVSLVVDAFLVDKEIGGHAYFA